MAVNPNWPLTVTSFAFNTDPFDPAAVPTYTDLSTRVLKMAAQAGRQYELDQVQAGEATLTVTDSDEALNPTNPSSPYYPNVRPYRQMADQAMWPPAPVGSAVNLLNTTSGYDPTFESYPNGSSVSWLTAVGGINPTVTTTNPQQGSQCITWTVVNGATVQGVSWPIPCIPGQQYTASAYVRQTSASTQRIQIGTKPTGTLATGTSTTTTGSYVRLSVTFTATQPVHVMQVATTGTAVAGTVNLDAVQVETGATANTFASTGPVIYGTFSGYVERWPSRWDSHGLYGMAELTAVDGLAVLAGQFLHTEYPNAVLAKKPDYYWPLSEPQGATSFAEVSGNSGPPLNRTNSKYGAAATFTPGTQTNIPGDPSGTGVLINSGATGSNTALTVIQTGLYNQTPQVSIASVTEPWSATWAWWVSHSAVTAGTAIFGRATDPTFNANSFEWLATSTQLTFNTVTVTDSWADSKPHLFVGVTTLTSSQVTDTLYVDGSQVGTATTLGVFFNALNTLIEFGADISLGTSRPGLPNATYAHVAVWNRALSTSEIADLNNAGKGYPNEGSGARVARYLGYNWIGPTSIDAGSSLMGVSDLAENTSILDAALAVAASEDGVLFADGTDTITFKSRSSRFLNTTAKWTFGELESPYEGDIGYDFDPQQVYNDVQVTRSGGTTVVGGVVAAQTASRNRYGKRSYTLTIDVASDLETQDRADWIFARHSDPVQRIAAVTLRPSANSALWPVCLGMRIGDRATVKRRTTAGYTMTSDYIVERIEWSRDPDSWTYSLQMSPTSSAWQPWILGDSTYGVLDVSTVLGF